MKTIRFVLGFFNDERYMLLLETHKKYRNVRIDPDGRITVCLTEDDIKMLEKLPRTYRDLNNLNNELLFIRRKEKHIQKA